MWQKEDRNRGVVDQKYGSSETKPTESGNMTKWRRNGIDIGEVQCRRCPATIPRHACSRAPVGTVDQGGQDAQTRVLGHI